MLAHGEVQASRSEARATLARPIWLGLTLPFVLEGERGRRLPAHRNEARSFGSPHYGLSSLVRISQHIRCIAASRTWTVRAK